MLLPRVAHFLPSVTGRSIRFSTSHAVWAELPSSGFPEPGRLRSHCTEIVLTTLSIPVAGLCRVRASGHLSSLLFACQKPSRQSQDFLLSVRAHRSLPFHAPLLLGLLKRRAGSRNRQAEAVDARAVWCTRLARSHSACCISTKVGGIGVPTNCCRKSSVD